MQGNTQTLVGHVTTRVQRCQYSVTLERGVSIIYAFYGLILRLLGVVALGYKHNGSCCNDKKIIEMLVCFRHLLKHKYQVYNGHCLGVDKKISSPALLASRCFP